MTFRLKNGNTLPNAREVSFMIHGQPQEDLENTINSCNFTKFLIFIFFKFREIATFNYYLENFVKLIHVAISRNLFLGQFHDSRPAGNGRRGHHQQVRFQFHEKIYNDFIFL